MKGLVQATVGFAADQAGDGVTYARIGDAAQAPVLRVPFSVTRYPALLEREVSYAAVTAFATVLRQRGASRARLVVEDARLAQDLLEHREIPQALTLAYVRLRCALNQFEECEIAAAAAPSDLTARARSEVALHVAA